MWTKLLCFQGQLWPKRSLVLSRDLQVQSWCQVKSAQILPHLTSESVVQKWAVSEGPCWAWGNPSQRPLVCLFLTPCFYQKSLPLPRAGGFDQCVLVHCKMEVQKYLSFVLGLERLWNVDLSSRFGDSFGVEKSLRFLFPPSPSVEEAHTGNFLQAGALHRVVLGEPL